MPPPAQCLTLPIQAVSFRLAARWTVRIMLE
jgi:hypothetical protein